MDGCRRGVGPEVDSVRWGTVVKRKDVGDAPWKGAEDSQTPHRVGELMIQSGDPFVHSSTC